MGGAPPRRNIPQGERGARPPDESSVHSSGTSQGQPGVRRRPVLPATRRLMTPSSKTPSWSQHRPSGPPGGDAGDGGAQQRAAVLGGAEAGGAEVLPGSGGVAVPGVVGDRHQDRGSRAGELGHLIGEDHLVADRHADLLAAPGEEHRRSSGPELAGLARQLVHEAEEAAEGDVLAEGHEMALVVARHGAAGGERGRRSCRRSRPPESSELKSTVQPRSTIRARSLVEHRVAADRGTARRRSPARPPGTPAGRSPSRAAMTFW